MPSVFDTRYMIHRTRGSPPPAGRQSVLAHIHLGNPDPQTQELTRAQYFVTVAPGVDLALIAALCVSFDECMNENNGS